MPTIAREGASGVYVNPQSIVKITLNAGEVTVDHEGSVGVSFSVGGAEVFDALVAVAQRASDPEKLMPILTQSSITIWLNPRYIGGAVPLADGSGFQVGSQITMKENNATSGPYNVDQSFQVIADALNRLYG